MTMSLFLMYVIAHTTETLALVGHESARLRYMEVHFRMPIYKANFITGKSLHRILRVVSQNQVRKANL